MTRGFSPVNGRAVGVSGRAITQSVITTIDDFEDGDIAEYSDETGSYAVTTTSPLNGSYRLEGTTPTGGGGVTIRSTSGLNYYPAQGDTFRYNFQFSQTDQLQAILFGATSGDTGLNGTYRVDATIDSSKWTLHHMSTSGTNTELASDTSVSYSTGVAYEGEVKWASDGTITCTLFDDTGAQKSQISATDTTLTSGGVGWRSYDFNDQSTIVHDFARKVA